jgi:hypothetical protein
MTSFVHTDYPTEHPGLARLARSYSFFRHGWNRTAHGSMALAAIVAAALVVANQVVDTWTDGHLLAAWIVMWLIAFGTLAVFATPARRAAGAVKAVASHWRDEQRQAREDRETWELALSDARVMADISRSMDARVQGGR